MSDETGNKMVPPPPPRPEDAAKAVEKAASLAPKPVAPAPQAPAPKPAAPAANPAPAPQAPKPAAPAANPAPAPQAPKPAAPMPQSPASGKMDKVSMPSDLRAPDASTAPLSPMPSASSPPLSSVEQEFLSDGPALSAEMPKVSSPNISIDGPSLMADSPPKVRGGFMKFFILLLLLGAAAAAAFFFFLSGDSTPKSRPLLPSPNEGRIERPAPPIPEPIVEAPPAPTESIYMKQCREHFNSSIIARGESPAAYGAQGDAYVESCAKTLEAQAAGGAQ